MAGPEPPKMQISDPVALAFDRVTHFLRHARIRRAIEQGRPCAQIAQQLQAVESAVESAKKALIHDHISHSLERSFKASGSKGQAALRDFRLIAKYL